MKLLSISPLRVRDATFIEACEIWSAAAAAGDAGAYHPIELGRLVRSHVAPTRPDVDPEHRQLLEISSRAYAVAAEWLYCEAWPKQPSVPFPAKAGHTQNGLMWIADDDITTMARIMGGWAVEIDFPSKVREDAAMAVVARLLPQEQRADWDLSEWTQE